MTAAPRDTRAGSTTPRPIQELTLTVIALALLVAITAGGFQLVKTILDRGQNQRVLNRVVELTENHLRLNRLDAAEQLLMRTMKMGHDIQQQEAWTFIAYVPAMPNFSAALVESLSAMPDDPESRILLADLHYRRQGAAAALAVFSDAEALTPLECVYVNVLAIESAEAPVFRAAEVNDRGLFEGLPDGAVVRTLSRIPPSPETVGAYGVGVRALYTGQLDAAESSLREAWEAESAPADAAYLLGRIAEARGDRDGAVAWYERAIGGTVAHAAAARAYVRLA